MKIFFIRQKKSKHGGAENYLERLSTELNKKNIKNETIHSNAPKLLPSWIKALWFNVQVCLSKKDKFYFSLDRITCPDIYRAGDGVHKEFLKTKNSSSLNPLHPIYLYLEKYCFKNAKLIIANSKMIKEQIISNYGTSDKKIKVIYNGVKLKEFSKEASYQKLSCEFNIKKDQNIILYVGSGFERKGVKEFLQIISKLETDFLAFIVGKEKKIQAYKDIASKLNISDKVIFTGARDDVDDFYAISDLFLFPTKYEPFSNVVLEAMSFGNVVFTTAQNGASEILEDDFIINSFADTTQKIDDLLSDPKELEKEKEKSLQKAQNFTIEKNASNTLRAIDEYLH